MKAFVKRFITGMSLVETLFASAVLSVVVVGGLAVTTDVMKSGSGGEARKAMISIGASAIEQGRHEQQTVDVTVDRTRLTADGAKGDLRATLSDGQITAERSWSTAGDTQKMILRSAIAGKTEALSTFMATCEGVSTGSVNTKTKKSKKSKTKSKSKTKTKSTGSSSWTGTITIDAVAVNGNGNSRFTVSSNSSNCIFGPSGNVWDDRTCTLTGLTASTPVTVTVDPDKKFCTRQDAASSGSCTTTLTLTEEKNAATLRMEFTQNVDKCENGPLITQ